MGKGDKKTKRGKLFKGSHGVSNPRKRAKPGSAPVKPVAEKEPKPTEKKVAKKKE